MCCNQIIDVRGDCHVEKRGRIAAYGKQPGYGPVKATSANHRGHILSDDYVGLLLGDCKIIRERTRKITGGASRTSDCPAPAWRRIQPRPATAIVLLIAIVVFTQVRNLVLWPKLTRATVAIHPALAFVSVIAQVKLRGAVDPGGAGRGRGPRVRAGQGERVAHRVGLQTRASPRPRLWEEAGYRVCLA